MGRFNFILCLIVVHFSLAKCRTTYVELATPSVEEITFMRKYGYLPDDQPEDSASYTSTSIADAVKKMQSFAGLPQTGLLDPETRMLFSKKRCGVKDIDRSLTRHRRYILVQGWKKKTITYRIMNGSTNFDKLHVQDRMAKALAMWAPHGNLDFVMVDDGPADIRVSFVNQDHGDGFPFDGPGRVVAHAFPPPYGAMHFDNEEIWGDNPEGDDDDITDFFAVAVHEIGHALGLSHSNVTESVMYPYYQVPVEKLGMDDILGMQELYFKDQMALTSAGTERPVQSDSSLYAHFTIATDNDDDDIPNLCYTTYDTIQVIKGKLFVFEEEWVWVMSSRKKVDPGYPRFFHEVFVGLPSRVNVIRAIYEKMNGNVVIFSGREYWEFNPKFQLIKISTIADYNIPLYVPELTTVFLSNYNNKTYLIEYERFWRFNERSWILDEGYPKDMDAWRGIPNSVDAAIIWQGDTFFFHGPRFWRFDNNYVHAHKNYPLPTAPIWFPCEVSPDMERYTIDEYR